MKSFWVASLFAALTWAVPASAQTCFWQPVAGGLPDSVEALANLDMSTGDVFALTVFDDGAGPALFAGGSFQLAGDWTARGIARLNGRDWFPLDIGTDGQVNALTVFDDGSGPALYAGGFFNSAGGAPASNIAKWDGTSWSPVGGGTDSSVRALTVFDDGTGSALYAGGLSLV